MIVLEQLLSRAKKTRPTKTRPQKQHCYSRCCWSKQENTIEWHASIERTKGSTETSSPSKGPARLQSDSAALGEGRPPLPHLRPWSARAPWQSPCPTSPLSTTPARPLPVPSALPGATAGVLTPPERAGLSGREMAVADTLPISFPPSGSGVR